jgi:hypothetical protein
VCKGAQTAVKKLRRQPITLCQLDGADDHVTKVYQHTRKHPSSERGSKRIEFVRALNGHSREAEFVGALDDIAAR